MADFVDPEIIRKIKAILNKDFLSRLIGDYLAAKILHEREKQLQEFKKLEEIIKTAKKSKDYKSALKEIKRWKENLGENSLSIYSFDRYYRPKVCTLLLIPSKELKNQEEATKSLKELKDKGQSMDSKSYAQEIKYWQDKFCISNFPDKLQNELNSITADVLKSISQKKDEETALEELQSAIVPNNGVNPLDSIASILSRYDCAHFSSGAKQKIDVFTKEALYINENLSFDNYDFNKDDVSTLSKKSTPSIQINAINDLKNIFNKNSHDLVSLLDWIYLNRKINFSDYAKDEIIKMFSVAGYKIPIKSSYSIPKINIHLQYDDFARVDDIRKDTILNYLGIISQGQTLSSVGKDNLDQIHFTSEQANVFSKTENSDILMILPVFNNSPELNSDAEKILYNESDNLQEAKENDAVYNIVIEDILEDPLATYELQNSKQEEISIAQQIPQNSKDSVIIDTSLQATSETPIPIHTNVPEPITSDSENSSDTIINFSTSEDNSTNNTINDKETLVSNTTPTNEKDDIISTSSTPTIETKTTTFCTEESFYKDSQVEPSSGTSETSEETIPSYTFSLDNQTNLEIINNESTYVLVALPIIDLALSRTLKKQNTIPHNDIEQEKNNGF